MGVLTVVFNTLIIVVSIFLICLILIQRGKGGGLAGAFGGVGGSSAFGTKAGDTFTRITVITAAVWMLMAMLLVIMTSRRNASSWAADAPSSLSKDVSSSSGKGKTKGSAAAPAPASGTGPSRPAEAPAATDNVPALPKEASFPPTPGSTPKNP